jgi:hypothetical protein
LSQLLGQFGLQLRRDQGQEFGVVCQEGLIDVRSIEDEHVVTRAEFHGTLKMSLVHFPVRFRTLEFHALGMDRASGSSTADGDNPGKTTIDHGRWLGLIGEQP